MNRIFSKAASVVLAAALLTVLTVPAGAQAEPEVPAKVVQEIAGEYVFSYQDQTLVVILTAEDGKLFGAPPGEAPEEIKPVEGKPLCFDVTVSTTGQYYELQFVRNNQGVIDKCVMTTMGVEIEGIKTTR